MAVVWQNKVAHYHAAFKKPVPVKLRFSCDIDHFADSGHCGGEVVGRSGILARDDAVKVFEVGQEYFYSVCEQIERFGKLIAAAVVDDGYFQLIAEQVERFADLRDEMSRADEVDVCGVHALKAQERLRKLVNSQLKALAACRDLVVLAEAAAQAAPRKKDCSRAFFAAEAWLFPHMQVSSCDANFVALAAKACCFCSVYAASSRAEGTAFQYFAVHAITSQ